MCSCERFGKFWSAICDHIFVFWISYSYLAAVGFALFFKLPCQIPIGLLGMIVTLVSVFSATYKMLKKINKENKDELVFHRARVDSMSAGIKMLAVIPAMFAVIYALNDAFDKFAAVGRAGEMSNIIWKIQMDQEHMRKNHLADATLMAYSHSVESGVVSNLVNKNYAGANNSVGVFNDYLKKSNLPDVDAKRYELLPINLQSQNSGIVFEFVEYLKGGGMAGAIVVYIFGMFATMAYGLDFGLKFFVYKFEKSKLEESKLGSS